MYICTFTCGQGYAYMLCTCKGEVLSWEAKELAIMELAVLNKAIKITDAELSWACLSLAEIFFTSRTELQAIIIPPHTLFKVISKNGTLFGVRLKGAIPNFFRQNSRSLSLARLI